ncbi:MAG TPA: hypothetical protein VGH40_24780 [Roseiarcus sp.]|jgi:hypothetical protein
MRNTLIGVVSSAAIGAAFLTTATPARADAAVQYPAYPGVGPDYYQGPGPAYNQLPSYNQAPAPAPAPAASNNVGDLFVYGGSDYHPPVFGAAYGANAAPPGALTYAGVCWLFPTRTSQGAHWEEVCR